MTEKKNTQTIFWWLLYVKMLEAEFDVHRVASCFHLVRSLYCSIWKLQDENAMSTFHITFSLPQQESEMDLEYSSAFFSKHPSIAQKCCH